MHGRAGSRSGCGWVCIAARRSRRLLVWWVWRCTGPPGSRRSRYGGQMLLSESAAALVRDCAAAGRVAARSWYSPAEGPGASGADLPAARGGPAGRVPAAAVAGQPGAAEQPAGPAGDVHRPRAGTGRGPGPGGVLPPGHADRGRGVRQDPAGPAGGRRAVGRVRRRGVAGGTGGGHRRGRGGAGDCLGARDRRAAGPAVLEALVDALASAGHPGRAGQLRASDRRLRQDRRAIVRRCPRVHLLATSREPLGIDGETVYRVPSLSLPGPATPTPRRRRPPTRSRCSSTGRGRRASACRWRADRPSRGVDLPPAGRHAAGDRAGRGAAALAVAGRPARPPGPAVPAAHRGQPHRAAAAADPAGDRRLVVFAAQRGRAVLLGRLSVFAGGFELDAAEAVCGFGDIEEFDVADLLGSLADKSLVVAEPTGGPCATGCWRPSASTPPNGSPRPARTRPPPSQPRTARTSWRSPRRRLRT